MQKSFATCVHTTYYLVSPFPEFVLQRVISCIYQPTNTRNRTHHHHESVLCQLCSRAE